MKYIIVSFKSRNKVLHLVKMLRQFNINADIISTPQSISKSCGLSAKVNYIHLSTVKTVVQNMGMNDFNGIYYLERNSFNERLQRLYWLIWFFLLKYFYVKNWRNTFMFWRVVS